MKARRRVRILHLLRGLAGFMLIGFVIACVAAVVGAMLPGRPIGTNSQTTAGRARYVATGWSSFRIRLEVPTAHDRRELYAEVRRELERCLDDAYASADAIEAPSAQPFAHVAVILWGVPFHSAWAYQAEVMYGSPLAGSGTIREGDLVTSLASGRVQDSWRLFPYMPLWDGVVLNSLVWGTVWFMSLVGARCGLRAWRRWRYRCEKCAYPLDGLPPDAVCPECGTARPTWSGSS